MAGTVLGDCLLQEEIGRGGAAVVFRGYQESLRRVVAVKVMRSAEGPSPSARLRFQTESLASAALEHPNIVPVYAVGEEAGTMFLVMKHVPGGSLAQQLAEASLSGTPASPLWPAHRIARFMALAARALHHAHTRGILHRDIKPGNILIDDSGDPLIADFGLAKFLETGAPALTLSGMVLGTPAYMAPEQALGHRHRTTALSDIYSLGAILYELLAGRPPFRAASVPALMRQIVEEPPPAIRGRRGRDLEASGDGGSVIAGATTRPEAGSGRVEKSGVLSRTVPKDLETITLKCLAKDPGRRYATALALAEDLERFGRGEPILARPVGKVERTWLWCRRKPALAVGIASMVSAVVVLLAGLGLFLGKVPQGEGIANPVGRADPRSQEFTFTLNRLDLERATEVAKTNLAGSFPYLTRILRRDPAHVAAGHRLYAALTYETLPRLAIPPLQHSNRVTFAVPSRDGKWIASTTTDGEAFVWNSETGKRMAGPLRHEAEANEIVFSADGERVVTASKDRTAAVWDWRGNRKITSVRHGDAVFSARFSPEGDRFATASQDQTTRIWSTATGELLVAPIRVEGAASSCAFSPDGKWLLTAGEGVLLLCDSRTGDVRHKVRLGGWIYSAQFDPKGAAFSAASWDGSVGVWSVDTGLPLFPVRKLEGVARVAEFCPDGLRIVTGGSDRAMQIWNARSGELLIGPIQLNGDLRFAHFSPDGSRIASVGWDHTFRTWDAFTGRELTVPVPTPERLYGSVFFPDGRRVMTVGNGRDVLVWDVGRRAARPLRLSGNGNPLVRWSPDGRKMLTIGEFEGCLVDLGPPVQVQTICYRDVAVDVTWSHDGGTVAVVGASGLVRVFEAETGRETLCGIGGESQVTRAQFRPQGRVLATADRLGGVREWNLDGPVRAESPVMAHPGPVGELHYDPSGRWLATASEDGIVRVRTSGTGAVRLQLPGIQRGSRRIAFSHDGNRLVVTSGDRVLSLWNVPDGTLQAQSDRMGMDIEGVEFGRGGSRIIVQTSGPQAHFLDAETLRYQVGPMGDPAIHTVLALDPEARRVLAGDDKGGLAFLDGATGQPVGVQWKDDHRWTRFAFSGSGDWLGTVQDDGVTSLWEMPRVPTRFPSELLDYAEAFAGHRLDPSGNPELIPPSRLWALEEAGREHVRLGTAGVKSERYGDMDEAWLRWFFDPAARSSLSPRLGAVQPLASIELGTTAPGATRQMVAPWSPRVSREWVDADPTRAPLLSSLVGFLVGDGHSPARVYALEAVIRSQRLMEIAEDKPWAWFSKVAAVRFHDGDSAARELLGQASKRFPDLPDFDVALLLGNGPARAGEAEALRERIGRRCLSRPIRWEFNHDKDFEGWMPNATMDQAEVQDGRLKLRGTWMCPSVTLREWVDGRRLGLLKVRMRHAARAPHLAVMWTRHGSEDATFDRMVQVPIDSHDTGFITYSLDLGSHTEWRGHFIREIVVGHFWGNPKGDIEVDWISLEPAE